MEGSKILMTKRVEDLPSSMFIAEPWKPPFDMNTTPLKKPKADDPAQLHKYQFDLATGHDVLWKNSINKPIKKDVL